ncbi:MAG: DUF1848 domain-containing protein [bacterium]|nr:DUF1848 domain-containing protein [bacterium]
MIVSASRRTDIPAFYAAWFMNRVRAGNCVVPNPFNPNQVSQVSLLPGDVDAIVFWTRNPDPLLPHLAELDAIGYRYYFLYTVLDNPDALDPGMPPLDCRLDVFRRLVEAVGPDRVVWRYDPIALSNLTPVSFHLDTYERLAVRLRGLTRRSIVSFVDLYRKLRKRLAALAEEGCVLVEPKEEDLARLLPGLASAAGANGMTIQSCAEERNLAPYGVAPGKCIDGAYLEQVLGVTVDGRKDRSQRAACGCVASRDIGCYDTCVHGCAYCYASSDFERARANFEAHDPDSDRMV